MKRKLFVSLLTLIALLAVIRLPVSAETKKFPCVTCGYNRTFEFVGYQVKGNIHYPLWRCTKCKTKSMSMSGSGVHSGGTATCTEKAVCSVCNHQYGDYAHDLVHHEAQAPTCTQDGYKAYDTCSKCSYTTYAVDPALDHDWGEWQSDDSRTHSRICKRDASHSETESHNLVHHEAKAATCTEIGWDAYDTCKRCNYTTYQEIAALRHDLVNHAAKKPTCTEIGWEAYDTCSRCDYTTYTELPIDPNNHDLVHHEAKAATCTEIGWDAYDTCKRCNYTTYQEIAALRHDLVNHAAKKPTCTEIGWEAYDTCSRCDYTTYTELPIDPNNHDLVHHEAKAATCTEIGWEEYDTCSRCDYTTYAELPIDPDNHDLMHHEAEEPTCTGIGWKAYDTCKRCDYTTYETIPALSHWYGEWTPNDNGGHSASCKRGCGHRGAVMCELFDYVLLAGDEKEDAFRLCPVCGIVSDGTRLELMEKAMAKALTRWLPAGEAVVRLGRIQNGEMLLSVAFEYAGRLTQPTGVVQITLPAEALEGFTLSILSPDGTEESLPYSLEDGKAVLVLDFTAAETPAQLIHLIPAA